MRRWPDVHARAVAALVLVIATCAAAVSGCGSSSSGNGVASKSPEQIIAASKAAAAGAKSVHVSGSIVASRTPITLDVDVLASSGARGSLTENGLGFELVDTAGTIYIKGSTAFYQHIAGSAAAALLQGKWLKASASSAEFAQISQLTNLNKLIEAGFSAHGNFSKGPTSSIKGTKAIAVTDASKGETLYVATIGPAYPLQLSKSGTSGGTVTLDRWNEPLTITPPAGAIDIAALRSGH